ncbi:MAG TPA: nuclear transport factor 2 family protein [Fontimonas sp.]
MNDGQQRSEASGSSVGTPIAEITALLVDYFDGLHFSDSARLARVFHPAAQYICATQGRLQHLDMPSYFAIVDRRTSPASRGEPRADRILAIELVGSTAASARVECAIGERHFKDLLSLIHLDGRWQIIAKVFDYTLPEATQRH